MNPVLINILHAVLFTAAVTVFCFAVIKRLRIAWKGQKETQAPLERRLRSFLLNVIFQEKLFKSPLRGIMHAFIFYGFVIYTFHTVSQMIAGNIWFFLDESGINPYTFQFFPMHNPLGSTGIQPHLLIFLSLASIVSTFIVFRILLSGRIYIPEKNRTMQWTALALLFLELNLFFAASTGFGEQFYDSILRIFSIFVLVGLIYFSIRRWILKAKGLDIPSTQSAVVILMISILMLSVLFGFGALSLVSQSIYPLDGFIDGTFKSILVLFGTESVSSANVVYNFFWWIHLLTVYAFMVYVPSSKHAHLIFAPVNFFFIRNANRGEMSKMDLEDENAIWGASKIKDFSSHTILDSLSCIECGRCTIVCPANRTGKPLDPKKIMVDIKHALSDPSSATDEFSIVSEKYISDEELFSCTTCMACVEACPVGNNQADAILNMRRYLVLQESRFPEQLQNAFNNMERSGNPWGVGAETRADWCSDLNVKKMAENSDVDVLYWVGCAGAFDDKNKKIARSFVKILNHAGVNFGILGTEESCTGDSARRGGNEYLYQMMAQQNIEILNGYNVKKIVTACPHCFNTLKNDYPQLGGNYEVMHHSQFIETLISEGKIKAASSGKELVYHDSCYLGRVNDIYDEPRKVLSASSRVKETDENRTNSLCCGAGGAQMWMEEKYERVNNLRTEKLLAENTDTIATACPFCNIMISDGVKNKDKQDTVRVSDIAEIIAENLI